MKNIIALLALLALSFNIDIKAQTKVSVAGVNNSSHWATGLPRTTLVEGNGSRIVKWSLANAPSNATAKVQLCAYKRSAEIKIGVSLTKQEFINTWCQDIIIGNSLANGLFDWTPEIPNGLSADYYRILVTFDLGDGTMLTNKSHAFRIRNNNFRMISITSPTSITMPQGGGFIPLIWTSKGIPANAVMEVRLSNPNNQNEYLILVECSNTGGQFLEIPGYLPPNVYSISVIYPDYFGKISVVSAPIALMVTAPVPE